MEKDINPKHFYKKKHRKKEIITDHAVVRFLQRNNIVDIKTFRKTLLTPLLKEAIRLSKNKKTVLHNENGLRFVCYDGFVLTIITYDKIRTKNGSYRKINDGTFVS